MSKRFWIEASHSFRYMPWDACLSAWLSTISGIHVNISNLVTMTDKMFSSSYITEAKDVIVLAAAADLLLQSTQSLSSVAPGSEPPGHDKDILQKIRSLLRALKLIFVARKMLQYYTIISNNLNVFSWLLRSEDPYMNEFHWMSCDWVLCSAANSFFFSFVETLSSLYNWFTWLELLQRNISQQKVTFKIWVRLHLS